MSTFSFAAPVSRSDALAGCLLGTAVGDALGLPYEGLSPGRAERLYGPPGRYRLLPGRGMVSDDTEHACLVAQALIASGQNEEAFARELARRLRWWLLGLPAGTGSATFRACTKLWLGFGPRRSGVWSAGNGPAMRAPILGAAVDDLDRLRALVRVSSRVTHTDPRAEAGALAVAIAARTARSTFPPEGPAYLTAVTEALRGFDGVELLERLASAAESVSRGETTPEFARTLGLANGVTGYVNNTVPVAVHAWLRHADDFETAVVETIRCGGDADTTAAIVGGLVGTGLGAAGIPANLTAAFAEWPRTPAWITRLAQSLDTAIAAGAASQPPALPALPLFARNVAFLVIVLGHGFFRLRPW